MILGMVRNCAYKREVGLPVFNGHLKDHMETWWAAPASSINFMEDQCYTRWSRNPYVKQRLNGFIAKSITKPSIVNNRYLSQ